MITYSTNWMGPINMDWYRQRNLTVTKTVVQEEDSKFTSRKKGDIYEVEEITQQYSAGRIDIRGVPDEPWGLEYGVAPMHGEDWNALGDFLWDFESEELIPYDELLELFEANYGKKIRWSK